jgi:hypothetical protein
MAVLANYGNRFSGGHPVLTLLSSCKDHNRQEREDEQLYTDLLCSSVSMTLKWREREVQTQEIEHNHLVNAHVMMYRYTLSSVYTRNVAEAMELLRRSLRLYKYTLFLGKIQIFSKSTRHTRQRTKRGKGSDSISSPFGPLLNVSILSVNAPLIDNLLYLLLSVEKVADGDTFIWLVRLLKEAGAADVGVDTDLLELSPISGIWCAAIGSPVYDTTEKIAKGIVNGRM